MKQVSALSDQDHLKLALFIEYFRSTWLYGSFSTEMWNKYGQDKHHQTNNAVESWHASLKHLLPTYPNIYIFIDDLKKQQAIGQLTIAKADAGQSPVKQKLKYRRLDKKLLNVN